MPIYSNVHNSATKAQQDIQATVIETLSAQGAIAPTPASVDAINTELTAPGIDPITGDPITVYPFRFGRSAFGHAHFTDL